jgi:hypothetical protein
MNPEFPRLPKPGLARGGQGKNKQPNIQYQIPKPAMIYTSVYSIFFIEYFFEIRDSVFDILLEITFQ